MTNWNPNATGTLGLEWQPIEQGVLSLDAITKMSATSLDQSASVGIGSIQIPNVGLPVRGGIYAVEVYDNETAVSDAASTLTAVPNEDVTDGAWLNESGNNTNLYASIDEGAAVSTADKIRVSGTGSTYWSRFNTASLSLTGKRILGLRLKVNCIMGPTGRMTRGLQIGGLNYSGGAGEVAGPQPQQTYTTTFAYNPNTKKPWTIADVQAFDSTGQWWVYGATTAGVWSVIEVYSVWLEVIIQAETRIAIGGLDDSASALTAGTPTAPAWNTATVLTPTGAAWTKDGAGRHLYTVRRLNSSGAMSIPYLDSLITTPSVGRSFAPTVDTTWGQVTAMGSAQTRLFPFVQRTTVPADHVDSQPYAVLKQALVRTGQNAEAEISGAAATNYGILRFMAYHLGATADLDIKVRRRSDSAQLGTTITLTRAAWVLLPDLGNGWRQVQLQLGTAATLAAATQYYIEFSSSTVSGSPWQVEVPSANGAGQVGTYNGTTDTATFNGVSDDTSSDIAVTLATIPTAPASMTAALGSQAVSETVNCVVAIPRADLSWGTTALGGSFLRYEIERSEDGGATWVDIANVSVESVNAWKDYEAPRGVSSTYRIRVVRQDGAFSAWATSGAVVKPLLAGTGAYAATIFLVSNYNPTQNLAYEYRPVKEYAFGEADEQTHEGAYFRDYYLAGNPIENRGVIARWMFLVGLDDKVPAGGGKSWTAFDPLRNLARAVIPYVCALDHRGQRLFCQLVVPGGSEDSTGAADRYMADVSGVQVTATPFVVAVTA